MSRHESCCPVTTRIREGFAMPPIRIGRLDINLDAPRFVTVDGKPVPLTGKEFGILELLTLRKGTIVTKEMFLDHLYSGRDEPSLKIIDVFLCKLRKKLAQATGGHHFIETVWGRGWVLRDDSVHPTPPPAPADAPRPPQPPPVPSRPRKPDTATAISS
jgi:two-component system cell cycle response regulator CtrA